MRLGMIGLGRMGGNMAERLMRAGHEVVAFDASTEMIKRAENVGATGAASLRELISSLEAPRTVWVMVPAGQITEDTVNELAELLEPGDTVIDGGNSNYLASQRRANTLAEKGIDFLDCGTSGGVWGLQNGYCLTVGGRQEAYERNRPIFEALAPAETPGGLYVGRSGAGHYVKMVHNGIEYGLMQAYAEGFEMLEAKDFGLDLHAIAENWRYGSVIRSWLLDLVADQLEEDPHLAGLSSHVDDSGEGRWTVQESVELGVPTPVITAALQARFRSRQDNPLGGRMLSAMRRGFGGHAIRKPGE